jgi:hypothetical protein
METIEIPTNVLVQCPRVQFNFARMGACVGCDYFAGLDDRFPGSSHPFAVRYLVKCTHQPVRRELKELAE